MHPGPWAKDIADGRNCPALSGIGCQRRELVHGLLLAAYTGPWFVGQMPLRPAHCQQGSFGRWAGCCPALSRRRSRSIAQAHHDPVGAAQAAAPNGATRLSSVKPLRLGGRLAGLAVPGRGRHSGWQADCCTRSAPLTAQDSAAGRFPGQPPGAADPAAGPG